MIKDNVALEACMSVIPVCCFFLAFVDYWVIGCITRCSYSYIQAFEGGLSLVKVAG